MKTIDVNYPQTIQECRPDQLTKWLMLAPFIQQTDKSLINMLDFQSQLVSIFTGLPINKVRKIHIDDIMYLEASGNCTVLYLVTAPAIWIQGH